MIDTVVTPSYNCIVKKREPVKTELLQARIAPAKLDAYKKAAASENRSLSNWTEWHLDAVVNLRPTTKRT